MALGPGAPLAPVSRTGSSTTRSCLQDRRSAISSRSRSNRCSTASRSSRSSRGATRSTTPTSSRSSRAIVPSRRSSRPEPSASGRIVATAAIVVVVAIATAAATVTVATNATVVQVRVVQVRASRVTADAATNRADHISRHRRNALQREFGDCTLFLGESGQHLVATGLAGPQALGLWTQRDLWWCLEMWSARLVAASAVSRLALT